MSNTRHPSSVDGIKRLAKALKRERGLPHHEALNHAAIVAGYQNFAHARRTLEAVRGAGQPASRPRTASPGSASAIGRRPLSEFHAQSRAAWVEAMNAVDPNQQDRVVWTGRSTIARVLEPFMGQNSNHAHLPTGGGQDFRSVALSREAGCLEFGISERLVYIAKPARLILERIGVAEGETFLLLELDALAPCGVYDVDEDDEDEADEDERRWLRGSEEVVEVGGEYLERGVLDRGYLGHDARGREIPLPDDTRLVVRWLRGKVLLVAKGSMWNGDPSTYDGRHDRMTSASIRRVIERSHQNRAA